MVDVTSSVDVLKQMKPDHNTPHPNKEKLMPRFLQALEKSKYRKIVDFSSIAFDHNAAGFVILGKISVTNHPDFAEIDY